ncbi:MAG: DNA-processing protein DprA [Deltaproteobacteria bacterium]|nr:DNA-processing protein DprA [Deltaproteobacteria bacterium]
MNKKMNQPHVTLRLARSDDAYPAILLDRLEGKAPETLTTIGPIEILSHLKTALFCSARTPGEAILRAHDMARRLRDEGTTVISGFHSSIERECLSILLRGKQPIIVCPARAIEGMRIPTECRPAFDAGRILFLSPFVEKPRRVDRESALFRNEIVAALADVAFLAHVEPSGDTERISLFLREWGIKGL